MLYFNPSSGKVDGQKKLNPKIVPGGDKSSGCQETSGSKVKVTQACCEDNEGLGLSEDIMNGGVRRKSCVEWNYEVTRSAD